LFIRKRIATGPWVTYTPLGKLAAEAYSQLAKGKKRGAPLCMSTEGMPMAAVGYWFEPALAAAGISDYTCLTTAIRLAAGG
jgi:hypothetical protein